MPNKDMNTAVEYLEDLGVLQYLDQENRTLDNAYFCFAEGVFPRTIEELFATYSGRVTRHEEAVAASRETGSADNVMLAALDQARSNTHNRLAAEVRETLGLHHWDHEKVRQLVSAVTSSLTASWIETRNLAPDPKDIETWREHSEG